MALERVCDNVPVEACRVLALNSDKRLSETGRFVVCSWLWIYESTFHTHLFWQNILLITFTARILLCLRNYWRHYPLLLSMMNLHNSNLSPSVCKLARAFQTWSPPFLCLTSEKPFAKRDANISPLLSPCIAVSLAIYYRRRGSWSMLLHKQVVSGGDSTNCLCDQIFRTPLNHSFLSIDYHCWLLSLHLVIFLL